MKPKVWRQDKSAWYVRVDEYHHDVGPWENWQAAFWFYRVTTKGTRWAT